MDPADVLHRGRRRSSTPSRARDGSSANVERTGRAASGRVDYGDELSDALDRLRDGDSLIGFEHALDAALLEYSDTLSSVYPVSASAVLAYILAKEREVENIRAIARGREVGLSTEEIEEELVIQ
ncbi:MAG: V-type ATPase subunit [Natrialbaceae archaeon]|nr:V-type ATPase subunit [Natrialbaceae archaeon]